MTDLSFPTGFLWGTATAPVQNEGSCRLGSWWPWEQRAGAIRNGDRSGIGCDWWQHAEIDFDLTQSMGHNALRLGVSWSRIEPEEGVYDRHALARYRQMLEGLRARGLEPMLTLHHFDNPLWLDVRGGWQSADAPARFGCFAEQVVEALGDLVNLWVTINEPLVYVRDSYLAGLRPPGRRGLRSAVAAARHLMQGHAHAYRAIHAQLPAAAVGIANHILLFEAGDPSRLGDRLGAWLLDWLFNGWKLKAQTSGRLAPPLGLGLFPHRELVDRVDFLGLNYYSRARVTWAPGSGSEFLAWGLPDLARGTEAGDPSGDGFMGEVYPEGLYRALKRLAGHGKPIYITENGLADRADRLRASFIVRHLAQVHRALAEGVDVRGYFHWTLVDNFEWLEGWQQRFGLVELDVETQSRRPRPSAQVYQAICRANGIPAGLQIP